MILVVDMVVVGRDTRSLLVDVDVVVVVSWMSDDGG